MCNSDNFVVPFGVASFRLTQASWFFLATFLAKKISSSGCHYWNYILVDGHKRLLLCGYSDTVTYVTWLMWSNVTMFCACSLQCLTLTVSLQSVLMQIHIIDSILSPPPPSLPYSLTLWLDIKWVNQLHGSMKWVLKYLMWRIIPNGFT